MALAQKDTQPFKAKACECILNGFGVGQLEYKIICLVFGRSSSMTTF